MARSQRGRNGQQPAGMLIGLGGSPLIAGVRARRRGSITGAAATSFKIEGVSHEFSSIPHVKEDVIELIMNLKGVNFKSFSEEPIVIELNKKGINNSKIGRQIGVSEGTVRNVLEQNK